MDFRYLTETKNEFNNFLCGILVPHLYEGISGVLEYSVQTFNMLEEKQKKNKNVQNPGIVNIFKMCLGDVASINNYEIETEYKRIKENSGCSDWFDNLIRATFKSWVLFLTWNPETGNSKYSDNEIYENISLKDFIHKCYVETCEYFKTNPEVFLKRTNKKEIFEIIKLCIETSIKKSLPYNDIIQEYLKINFTAEQKQTSQKEIDNIKALLYKIMAKNKYGSRPVGKALISEDSEVIDGEKEVEEFINVESNQQGGGEEEELNKEIFRPHSVANSKEGSVKSKSTNATSSASSANSTTSSDNFDVPKMHSRHSSKTDSDNKSKSKETGSIYKEITNTATGLETGISTQILTRTEAKKQELEQVLNPIEEETSPSKVNLDSPLPIRKKHTDRIDEHINERTVLVGGNGKKKVQIVKNKSNSIHDKVSSMNDYFNSLMNN
jgi:hypothetical protein